ncbi:hypothetical protein GGX14DRAFT_404795 [Mycena pura]|uniref:Uncharacterized protein n=1 Tax=Mycena pura TaxID=153505 RepID=A0AAD6UV78_9AGAR|nr:hypothetical protein GGX14DRAFT_404795 [Mycena pura]
MATILPLSAADVRKLPEATFGDPVRQRGGEGAKPKKRPKSGAGAGDGQEDGNGKQKKVSWIWVTQVDRGNPAAVNEALRARTRAKAHRWSEEVDLLEEEMRRIRAFLTWHSKWWMERAQCVWQADEVPVTREGLQAYARQAKPRPSSAPASDGGQGSVIAASSSSSRETPVGDAASGVDNESALVVDGVVERSSQVGNDYVILMLTEHDDLKCRGAAHARERASSVGAACKGPASGANAWVCGGRGCLLDHGHQHIQVWRARVSQGPGVYGPRPSTYKYKSSTPRTRARARTVPGCSACARTCEQRAKGAQGPAEPMRGCVAGARAYWTMAINIYKCVAGVARKGLAAHPCSGADALNGAGCSAEA